MTTSERLAEAMCVPCKCCGAPANITKMGNAYVARCQPIVWWRIWTSCPSGVISTTGSIQDMVDFWNKVNGKDV